MSNPSRSSSRAACLVAAVLGLAALGSTPARAAVLHVGRRGIGVFPLHGHSAAASAARARGANPDGPIAGDPPLLYQGGPVVHAMTAQVIYWLPGGFSFPDGFAGGLDRFMTDIAASAGAEDNDTGVARQYVDPNGPALTGLRNPGSTVDGNAFPTSGCPVDQAHALCLSDQQIADELASFLAAAGLPGGLDRSYVVVTPPQAQVCLDASGSSCEAQTFCGYHSVLTARGLPTTYTVLPYPGPGCQTGGGPHSPDVDAATSIEAHELLETATDPEPGSGYVDASGNEVGDLCAWLFGSAGTDPFGAQYNQLLNGNEYLLQEMWSDAGSTCAQGLASPVATASITGNVRTVQPGGSVTYTAGLSSDSAGAVSYQWQYAAAGGSSPVSFGSGSSASLSFPHPGTYTVWVTIIDAGGGTLSAAVQTTALGTPRAQFNWTSGASAQAGTAVTFVGSGSSSPNAGIARWQWSFGDGTTAGGATARHAYATAGSYTVTLTVTDAAGATASTQQLIDVRPRTLAARRSPPSLHAKLVRRRRRYKLTVTGSGFAGPGSVIVTIGAAAHRWSYRVHVNGQGDFAISFLDRVKMHLIGARRA